MAEHILVGLSSAPSNARIIRTAATMSQAFGGSFTALFVRTPDYDAMSEADRDRLRQNTKTWIGKTVGQLDIRKKFSINILAVKTDRKLNSFITPDTLLSEEMSLMVMGTYKGIQKCFRL